MVLFKKNQNDKHFTYRIFISLFKFQCRFQYRYQHVISENYNF